MTTEAVELEAISISSENAKINSGRDEMGEMWSDSSDELSRDAEKRCQNPPQQQGDSALGI